MKKELRLKPIKKLRLYEGAVDQIKSLILANNYKPGDRLPSERELAEQLSIGRPSVREALRILGVMGLVEIRVGDGTYVKDVSLLPYVESLVTLISSRLKIREENILKLWEVRRILETGNVGLSCSRMTRQHLEKMGQCIQEMEENIGNREAFISSGIRFHRQIAEATGNEILVLIWNNLWDMILHSDLYRRRHNLNYRVIYSPRQSFEGHKKIYRALIQGNHRGSLEAMEEHLNQEEEALLTVLKTRKKSRKSPSSSVRRPFQ